MAMERKVPVVDIVELNRSMMIQERVKLNRCEDVGKALEEDIFLFSREEDVPHKKLFQLKSSLNDIGEGI